MLAVFGHSFCLPSDGRAFQQSQVYAFPLPPAALNKYSQEGLEEQCCHLGTPESSERGVFCSLGGSDFCWVCWLWESWEQSRFWRWSVLAWILFSYKIIISCVSARAPLQLPGKGWHSPSTTGSSSPFTPTAFTKIRFFMFIYRSFFSRQKLEEDLLLLP